jgi:hypothetical protein
MLPALGNSQHSAGGRNPHETVVGRPIPTFVVLAPSRDANFAGQLRGIVAPSRSFYTTRAGSLIGRGARSSH